VAVATATSGRTAVYSGLVVIMAAACLLMVRWAAYRQFMVGVSMVIVAELVATLTLTPAALVVLTRRLEWRPLSRRRTGGTAADGGWARWSRHLMRHPWPYLLGITAGLLLLALPSTGLKLGIDMERPALRSSPTGTGVELVEREQSRGLTGMMVMLIERPSGAPAPDLEPLAAGLRADPLVATVTSLDNGRDASAVFAVPRVGADSPRLVELVHRVRGEIGPRTAPPGTTLLVGGPGPTIVDLIDECAAKMWWVIGAVLALLFGLLVVVFRSLLLPLKAIVLNLLVTSAAFGLLVLVFQRGVGANLLGFTSPGLLWVHVPLVAYTVAFAVSLDYEIFLVRRIQEEYLAGGDNTAAVAAGIQRTARPITLAAMIMAAAFGSLLAARIVGVKEMGFAVAVAIVLDATVVRLALVPALMKVLGRWNWWLPFAPADPRTRIPSAREPRSRYVAHERSGAGR
jgi:RND superfamily putative drug exporter